MISSSINSIYNVCDWGKLYDNTSILVQLIFGAFAIRNLASEYVFKEKKVAAAPKTSTLIKTIALMGNISVIGTALTTKPMLAAWKWSANYLKIEHHFEDVGEKWLHFITLANFILGLPATIKFVYDSAVWLKEKWKKKKTAKVKKPREKGYITPVTTRKMKFYMTMNTIAKGTHVARHLFTP